MSQNVADLLVSRLAAIGVREIFGVPGDAINHLVDALRRQEVIRFIQVRHEEAGAFAASAQAKLTGRLAVCAGTAGPGAIHLLNGLYDAAKDGAPVLAITGQVPTVEMGLDFHQEIDQHALFSQVAACSRTVINADSAWRLIDEVIRVAQVRSTVSHLALPSDIAGAHVSAPPAATPMPSSPPLPDDMALVAAAGILNGAKKVAILAGIGCRDAVPALTALSDRLQAPIVLALRGKDLLPEDHPNVAGGLGLLGGKPGLHAMQHCDAVLLAGTGFPYRDFLPAGVPAVQIDRDPARIGLRLPVAAPLAGDARATLEALAARITPGRDTGFLEDIRKQAADWRDHLARDEQPGKGLVPPALLAARIAALARDDAIFTCGTGEVTLWAARHLHLRPGQRFTLSSSLASMAFELPGAIGAQLAYPDRQVISVGGDGGFTMLCADFLTAVKYKLPITCVVFNNGKLGLIEIEEEKVGLPRYAVDLQPFDFAGFATVCGGRGWRVDDAAGLDTALAEAYAHPGPAIVDVAIDPDILPLPPRITLSQALGFGTAKVKELFSKDEA